MKITAHIAWVLLLLFVACKPTQESDNPALTQGYEYYPLQKGLIRIYKVDSIAYDDNTGKIDTFQLFYKEIVSDRVLGQTETNQHTQILRFAAMDTAGVWQPRLSIFALQSLNNLQVVDDNIRYAKLTFPLGNIASWNGNMYNSLGRRTFLFLNRNFPYSLSTGLKFSNCTQIQEANIKNAIEEIFVKSVYAAEVGLIEFTNTSISTQGSKKSGYAVKQVLLAYY